MYRGMLRRLEQTQRWERIATSRPVTDWRSCGDAIFAKLCLGFLLLLLNGCVTTSDAPKPSVDLGKAEQTHIQAGLGYLRKRDRESAHRHFLKALELNSASPGAHNGLALVYQMQLDDERAEQHFLKALSFDPEFSLARNNYAALLFRVGRFSEAEQQLIRVVEDYNYGRREIALMNLGRTRARLQKWDDAIKSLKQSLAINFRLSTAHLELADIYYQLGQFDLARHYFNQYGNLTRQTPRSLWLGIRIERQFGNADKIASYALALKNLHATSEEYRLYRQSEQ